MTTNTEKLSALDSIPEQVYNPHMGIKKEENKKIAFIQAAFAIFKIELKKLIQDAFLREEMFKEWVAKMEDARFQSSKEAWDELFQAILKEIEQGLKQRLNAEQLKVVTAKLNAVLQQVKLLSTLKAEFVEEQKVIDARISDIESRSEDIGVALSEIETFLAEPTAGFAEPMAVLGKLDAAAKKVVHLHSEVDSVRREYEDVHKVLNAWMEKFNKAASSTETSFKELSESISDTGLMSNSILKEMPKKESMSVEDQLKAIHAYKECLSTTTGAKLDAYDLKLYKLQADIQKQAAKDSSLTGRYAFLTNLNSSSLSGIVIAEGASPSFKGR